VASCSFIGSATVFFTQELSSYNLTNTDALTTLHVVVLYRLLTGESR